jgi:hypothetical protein
VALPIAPAYVQGSDLPDLTWTWKDGSQNIIDLTAYTFVLKVGQPGVAASFTKSTGIIGASTSPNLTIAWATTGELNTIPAGRYIADLIATRNSDSKARTLRFILPVEAAIT